MRLPSWKLRSPLRFPYLIGSPAKRGICQRERATEQRHSRVFISLLTILLGVNAQPRPVNTSKKMAGLFQVSQDNVQWQTFSGELSALKEKLLATFPPP